ncbi:hypothetical protein QJS66_17235 [Kocuria rhizophila]|nr:hypothetical protein QJS66_17235 [Kocuria rhizophila]
MGPRFTGTPNARAGCAAWPRPHGPEPGPAVVESALRSLGKRRRVVSEASGRAGDRAASDSEWCGIEVLRTLRRRSLAALRAAWSR